MISEPASSAEPNSDSGKTELCVLLEDGPLLALSKPAGLLTQGVPAGLPSLESLVKDYLRQKYDKPGNVYLGVPHRLDRPVSGIVLFAKNSKAAARLAEQFRDRTIRKIYLAVTESIPNPDEGKLADWLLKDSQNAHVTVVDADSPGAKQASLGYEVIAVKDGRALVKIELHTGRMHQIRVQFASRGWPIVGDQQYDAKAAKEATNPNGQRITEIALHAWQLTLKHPIRYDTVQIEAPLPGAWDRFGFVLPKGA